METKAIYIADTIDIVITNLDMRICVKMDNFQNITKTGVRSSLQGNYTTGVVKYNAYKVILEIPLKEFDWISSFIKFSSRNKMLVFDNSLRKRENSC